MEMRYLTDNRTTLVFDMPLAEVVTDFFDMLKSKSKVRPALLFAAWCSGCLRRAAVGCQCPISVACTACPSKPRACTAPPAHLHTARPVRVSSRRARGPRFRREHLRPLQ